MSFIRAMVVYEGHHYDFSIKTVTRAHICWRTRTWRRVRGGLDFTQHTTILYQSTVCIWRPYYHTKLLPPYHTKPPCAHEDYTTIPNHYHHTIPNHSVCVPYLTTPWWAYEDYTTIPNHNKPRCAWRPYYVIKLCTTWRRVRGGLQFTLHALLRTP